MYKKSDKQERKRLISKLFEDRAPDQVAETLGITTVGLYKFIRENGGQLKTFRRVVWNEGYHQARNRKEERRTEKETRN